MPAHTRRTAPLTATLLLIAAATLPGGLQAGVIVESELTDARTLRPGETYTGTISLRNTGDTPGEVKLYQTDYDFDAEGNNDYGPPGRSPRSNAGWIQLDRNQLRLPPHSAATVSYRLRVPAGQGMHGTYWSMIMVEPIPADSAESAEPLPERTTRLSQVLRYALQVVSDLGGAGVGELAFGNAQILDDTQGRRLAVDVSNTGQRWIRAQFWLELYRADGSPMGKLDGPKKRLFPGTSARFEVPLGATPPGRYIALAVADGGGDSLFGANLELEVPAAGSGSDTPR